MSVACASQLQDTEVSVTEWSVVVLVASGLTCAEILCLLASAVASKCTHEQNKLQTMHSHDVAATSIVATPGLYSANAKSESHNESPRGDTCLPCIQ